MATSDLDTAIEFLLAAVDRAFDRLVEYFKNLQVEELEAEKWEWYGQTKRSSGEVAGLIRNIVDSGDLKNTLRLLSLGKSHTVYDYPVPYAELVHEGGVT